MQKQIEKLCKSLRIGSLFSEKYKEISAETNEEFLLKLLTEAVTEREVNRKNRLLKQANFDLLKTFGNYIFDKIQIPEKLNIEDLKNGNFIEKNENLILYGGVGTGKTHMATAIGVSLINRGKNVKFFRTATLVNMLVDAKRDGTIAMFLRKLKSIDLLICDEWGYIPIDNQGAQLLFQVIADCYEKRSLIITTNLDFNNWNTIFFDEKLTSAIIDRLVHHSHLLIFSGESYRLKNSLMR